VVGGQYAEVPRDFPPGSQERDLGTQLNLSLKQSFHRDPLDNWPKSALLSVIDISMVDYAKEKI
jgi:hypothetical protein